MAEAAARSAPNVVWARLRPFLWFAVTVAFTFLGLLAITFVIGRVVPIDPVLAVVGDRAPQSVYLAAREAMGIDDPLPVQFAPEKVMTRGAMGTPSKPTVTR